MTRGFPSPLWGTLVVMLSLAALAIPLRKLTAPANATVPVRPPPNVVDAGADLPAVLRVRWLDPLASLEVADRAGKVVFQKSADAAGEDEVDLAIPGGAERVEWILRVKTGEKDTAVFVTLMPDGREERGAHAIGSGSFEEVLVFDWSHE